MARMIFAAPDERQALERASEELDLPVDALDYEVLEDTRGQELADDDEPGVCLRVSVSLDHTTQVAKELLQKLIEQMAMEATIETRMRDGVIHFMILGPNSSILIGREGQTLDSIQHWLTRAVARVIYGAPRLLVDVENYRERKFDKYRRMARQAAHKALETGAAERLDPMGPIERKFVHNCVKDIEGVSTYSIGREGRRRVVIAPTEKADQADLDSEDMEGDERSDSLVEDDMLASRSAYSQMRVIATPERPVGDGDEELEDDDEIIDEFSDEPYPSSGPVDDDEDEETIEKEL